MLFADGSLALVFVVIWVYCILEVITTDASEIRNLPKLTWLFLVIVLSDIGSIAWLVAGRPTGKTRSLPYRGSSGVSADDDRPGRATANNPDDDAAFLAQLRERAESQRKEAAEQARRIRDEEQPPPA